MDFYRIVQSASKVYIKTLIYNPKVWNGHQWRYLYVTEHYPSEYEGHAKNFRSIEAAEKWIEEHTP